MNQLSSRFGAVRLLERLERSVLYLDASAPDALIDLRCVLLTRTISPVVLVDPLSDTVG